MPGTAFHLELITADTSDRTLSMKLNSYIIALALCATVMGCTRNPLLPDKPKNADQAQPAVPENYSGYDINGGEASCEKIAGDAVCTEIYGPGDAFADQCAKAGGTKMQCDCHEFLCSIKIDYDNSWSNPP